MTLGAGQVVNERYRIARQLGTGGMGAVYRAWDLVLNIPVALKEMLPDPSLDESKLALLREQFRQEARTLAGLQHPCLPRVTDFFIWSGNDYLVMDFVEGESLAKIIARRGAVPEEEVVAWGVQLLSALSACHRRNILHRDIKPQNIIIRSDGRAVLVDFGLVKHWDPGRPETQRIIRGMGTREYASPEQFGLRPGSHTEPRSDIYSLGATLYHALTGREPPSAMDRLIDHATLVPPRTLDMRLDPGVEAVILSALALEPERRYPTVDAMTEALERKATMPGPARTVPSVPTDKASDPVRMSMARPQSRSQWPLELATGLLLALVAALSLQAIAFSDGTPPEQYVGLGIGALVIGALGWFLGDIVFEAVKPADPATGASNTETSGSPTQRLVMSTRRLVRRMTPAQQIGLLFVLVVLSGLAARIIGPMIHGIPWLWDNLPSWAIAAPLVFAATGRRQGLPGLAHALVTVVGGMVLKASTDTTTDLGALALSAAAGSVLIEGCIAVANKAFFGGRARIGM